VRVQDDGPWNDVARLGRVERSGTREQRQRENDGSHDQKGTSACHRASIATRAHVVVGVDPTKYYVVSRSPALHVL